MPRLSASSQHRIRFTLNGRLVSDLQNRACRSAADFIRHVIGATGTHVGCEHGVCGACTVDRCAGTFLDHALQCKPKAPTFAPSRASRRRRACRHCKMLSATINAVLQCGFCTPGILMSLDALLRHWPMYRSRRSARFCRATFCRCTGYGSIVRAALAAARRLREESPHA